MAKSAMSDRTIQDQLIRYLTDAPLRMVETSLPIAAEEAEKAGRFSRFLARRYYRDRLVRGFHYSREMAPRTGRRAEEVCDLPSFDGVLEGCVLGSLLTGEAVAALAVEHLSPVSASGDWWGELLRYEAAFFLQVAVSERSEQDPPPGSGTVQRAISARLERFAWRMPELLAALKKSESPSDALRGECALLFSRTHQGRIYVVEVEPAVAALFAAVNGLSTVEQVASRAGCEIEFARQTLAALAEIGAVSY
jgi:hypothetical protein